MPLPPCEVLADNVAAVPHADGQQVLHVRSGQVEFGISYTSGLYRIVGFLHHGGNAKYTVATREAVTTAEARDQAAELIREHGAV